MPHYYNAHIHVFNFRNTPENFLQIKVPAGVVKIVNAILNRPLLAKILMATLNPFLRATGKKMLAFIKIGLKKTPEIIFEDLMALYPPQDDVGFIILPMDFTHMNAGDMDKVTYPQQLEELFALKLKYPNKAFPFVAIDPRSGNAAENKLFVEKYINRGFSGIKLYPALGYFGYHPNLYDVYAYAQANEIPILTHCSRGGVNLVGKDAPDYLIHPPCFNKLPGRTYHFAKNSKTDMQDYCDYMNDPENFEEVLDTFPTLKICFAHFGIDSTTNFTKGTGFTWYKKIIDLMKNPLYTNVYADISYTAALPDFIEWFTGQYALLPEHVQKRILYGTDFFMTLQEDNGNDDQLLAAIKQGFGDTLFLALAKTNVERFLKFV